jgi:hypothetical protein
MPTYVYQVILEGDEADEGQIFEVDQKMSDPPLTHHPETGQPVRRLITAPNISTRWSPDRTKNMMSDSNLAAKGFTKYVKTGDGTYEKTAGDGPRTVSADGIKM